MPSPSAGAPGTVEVTSPAPAVRIKPEDEEGAMTDVPFEPASTVEPAGCLDVRAR